MADNREAEAIDVVAHALLAALAGQHPDVPNQLRYNLEQCMGEDDVRLSDELVHAITDRAKVILDQPSEAELQAAYEYLEELS